jgi:hypothetical protein
MPFDPSGGLAGSIGSLRWRVTLYRRDQTPDPGLGVKETLVPIATVQADIQPTYPSTFYNAVAVDTPVSHLIRARWFDYIENTHVIMRSTLRPREQIPVQWDDGATLWDDGATRWDLPEVNMGSTPWDNARTPWDGNPVPTLWDQHPQRQRTELYRVRRIKEIAGRKRFVEFECELERAHTTYDDDASRQAEFMEPTIVGEPLQ